MHKTELIHGTKMQDLFDSIACKGESYNVSIYSIKLDIKFCFPKELRKSLYLECHDDFIHSLSQRPVVGYMLETSPLHDKKVVLGDILIAVNDVQVDTPREANSKIRTSRRPLKLLFYAPRVKLTVSEGFHMCKYNTSTAKPPSSSFKWKPKYVVVGGVIAAHPWMMYMYRNKVEYDQAVMESISGKNVSVKVKRFSLLDAILLYKDQSEIITYEEQECKNWNYYVIIPNKKTRHNPIKIASPNDLLLRPVHEAVQRIINQDDFYEPSDKGNVFSRASIVHHRNNDTHAANVTDDRRRNSTGSLHACAAHRSDNNIHSNTQGRRNSTNAVPTLVQQRPTLDQQRPTLDQQSDHYSSQSSHYNDTRNHYNDDGDSQTSQEEEDRYSNHNNYQGDKSETSSSNEEEDDDYYDQASSNNNHYNAEDGLNPPRRRASINQYDVTSNNNNNKYPNNASYSFRNAQGERTTMNRNSNFSQYDSNASNASSYSQDYSEENNSNVVSYSFRNGERITSNNGRVKRNLKSTATVTSMGTRSTATTEFTGISSITVKNKSYARVPENVNSSSNHGRVSKSTTSCSLAALICDENGLSMSSKKGSKQSFLSKRSGNSNNGVDRYNKEISTRKKKSAPSVSTSNDNRDANSIATPSSGNKLSITNTNYKGKGRKKMF